MPVHTWAPADALEAKIARLQGINTRETPISPVVLERGQVSESPRVSHSVGLGGTQALHFFHRFRP